jgi:hypothetical protein
MRTLVFAFAMIFAAASLPAQPFGGLSGTAGFPYQENQVLDYSLGMSITGGYQFSQRLQVAAVYDVSWLPSRWRDLTITELMASSVFIITDRLPVSPYIGISAGAIRRVGEGNTDFGLVAAPLLGFETGASEKGLFFDASVAFKVYSIEDLLPESIFFSMNMNMFFIKAGIKYKF